ncbi:MAG: hypothetical protein PHY47_01310 [Lachnospiraceae bacterium]|nr:hypothetical protein [Lachnospiraceae bacterium]
MSGKPIRKYTEPLLQCNCGSEFFEKVTINKFKDIASDLSYGQKEMVADHKVTLLRCVGCDEVKMPVLSYNYMSPLENEIARELVDLLADKKAKKNEANIPKE